MNKRTFGLGLDCDEGRIINSNINILITECLILIIVKTYFCKFKSLGTNEIHFFFFQTIFLQSS